MLSAHAPSVASVACLQHLQTQSVAFVQVQVAGADVSPVQRLTGGSQFHGYDYIPGDGSAPPALAPPELGNLPVILSRPVTVGTGQGPPKEKPSIEPGDVPPSVAGPTPTPLAQTPSAASSVGSRTGAVRQSIAVPNPGAVIRPSAPAVGVSQTPAPIQLPPVYLGTVAMAAPGQALFAAESISPAGVSGGLAYASNHAADALALLSPGDGVGETAAYNFVHFNPAALLNDALAAFTRESASISVARLPAAHSAGRAWTITAGVIGADLLLVGYWYQKGRRKSAGVARGAAEAERGGTPKRPS